MIIETKRKLLQRDQEVADFARRYRGSHNGKIDDGFTAALQDYSQQHPLFPQAPEQTQAAGPSLEDINAEIARRQGK